MDRTEFEARLLRDPELRQRMEKLEQVAERVRQLQRDLFVWRQVMQYGIGDLASEGVPLAILAHLVGLSPQRMNSIVKEATDEELRASWTESMERLEQEELNPDDLEALVEQLRARRLELDRINQQEASR
jgi:hypothetical protein